MRVSETEMTLENPFNIKQYPILDVDCVEREEIDGVHDSALETILKNKVPSGNWDQKKTQSYEWDVMQVTKDWRTIQISNPPFGNPAYPKSNVWNHEWCEQFINYEKNEEWNESNHLCENREFWTEKMIPLMKEEDSDWESSCELDDRLDDMNEIASRYSTSYQMNQ